ncbi:WbqC family protein [Aliarcobacter butzleri]|uniref:WbqC family protein n=1 Tax=Aliarcobacter butzleri TaxID=28197 RepID=UPI003AF758A2
MISIHQSQFLPWIPYFYKILKSDIFIIMDDVQYQKNGVQNRNSIKTPTGVSYLTIPTVSKSTSLIKEVTILNSIYLSKFLKTLSNNYSKAKYFNIVYNEIKTLIENNNYLKLDDFNKDLIFLILELINANVEVKYSSQFSLVTKKDDLVLDLILACGKKSYITGTGGLEYMDLDKFYKNDIEIYQYYFQYKPYTQLWEKQGFIKNLSIIDLLFNDLEIAKDYILNNGSLNLLKR